MWTTDVKRPNYRDGMYLGARDFVAEQGYELDMRRRLALAQHAWGIFEGLRLVEQPQPGGPGIDVFIEGGLAVDGFGRTVVVFTPAPLNPGLFQVSTFATDQWVKVWLLYATAQTDPPRPGYELCDDPALAYRTLETYTILVGDQPGPHTPIRIAGQLVLDTALPPDLSVGYQALPDDAEGARWPICLGQIHWNGVDGFVVGFSSDPHAVLYRAPGGVIGGRAYAPDGVWDLSSRLRDPSDNTKVLPLSATIHGSLTVEGLIEAKNSVQLDGGHLLFDDATGNDQGRQLSVTRVDNPGNSDLQVEIGTAQQGHDRFVVMAGATPQFVVQETGDAQVVGELEVDGLLDLSIPATMNGKDKVVFGGTADQQGASSIGLESGGRTLFERSQDGINWYLNQTPGNPASMAIDPANGLRVAGGLLVGWGGNARIRTRHVDGKSSQNDGLDDLYLNWDNGKDVVVGNANAGGMPSSLYVSGNIFIGQPPNQVKLVSPIDVQAGTYWPTPYTGTPGGSVSGTDYLTLTPNLSSVSNAVLTVGLADIQNNQVATWPEWKVWVGPWVRIGNQVRFDINWTVADDGQIRAISYVAIFYP